METGTDAAPSGVAANGRNARSAPVASGRVADREELPRFVEPMLARSGLPADEGWAVEVKRDGIRGQLRVDRGRWSLRSRPGRVCTDSFPELGELADALRRRRLVLDGELVHLGADGKPDFTALRRRLVARGARRRSLWGAQRRIPPSATPRG
jgi:ATP-dependent DNA ligase